jgi:hypothetical protein
VERGEVAGEVEVPRDGLNSRATGRSGHGHGDTCAGVQVLRELTRRRGRVPGRFRTNGEGSGVVGKDRESSGDRHREKQRRFWRGHGDDDVSTAR